MSKPLSHNDLLREVARRMAAGEGPAAIARACGIKEKRAWKMCKRISAATGAPTRWQQFSADRAEILRRTAAGETPAEIAQALGKTEGAVAQAIRKMLPQPRLIVRSTPDEIADMKARAARGEDCRAIAAAVGCSIWTAARHTKAERAEFLARRNPGTREMKAAEAGRQKRGPLPGEWDDTRSTLPEATLRTMRALMNKRSAPAIAEATGVSLSTVQKHIRRWRARTTRKRPNCACGRPFGHPGGCIKNAPNALSARWEGRFEKLLEEGLTLSDIARRYNLHRDVVSRVARPAIDRLTTAGVRCGCGRQIAHGGGCSHLFKRGARQGGARPVPFELAKRIRPMLLSGEQVEKIRDEVGTSFPMVWKVNRSLSPDEQQRRRAAMLARRRLTGDRYEQIVELVRQAIPAGTEASIKDEVVSDASMAIIEGRLQVDRLKPAVRRMIARLTYGSAEERRQRDIDGVIAGDKLKLSDVLGDSTADEAIEDIEIGDRENG
jgi:uncharacterized protein YerC